ncbi:MAG: chromate transporter [Acidobacteria bacterium]|nr:chromate transporter [Acidobacteriota bacterium]
MVSLARLSLIFLRISNLTMGGGDPTMAALERELVERRRWLTPEQYGLSYGLARITPGTNVLAFSAAAAWFARGWPGALIAVVAAILPSAVLVVWLTRVYELLKGHPLAMGAISGLLAAAVGMMGAAAWNLARPHVHRKGWARTLVLLASSILLLLRFSVPPVQVLALAALAGFFWRDAGRPGEDRRPGEPR